MTVMFASLLLVRSLIMLQTESISGPAASDTVGYRWIRAVAAGNSREEKGWQEGTWPRVYTQQVVFNDTLFVIGSEHTWKSSDGVHWKRFSHDGRWGIRYGASYSTYDGRIWITGGSDGWEKFENDVWSSPDGLHWTLVTAHAPWAGRRGHAAVVYQSQLWIIGGAESSGQRDVLPVRSFSDVWRSENGKHWYRVGINAPWQTTYSKDFFSTSVSAHLFNGRLWVLGGLGGEGVWQSTDGSHWMKAIDREPRPPGRLHRGSVVFDNRLWMFGGPGLNDVWFTGNGDQWTQLSHAPWSPRAPYYCVVFQGRIWMFGGKTGPSGRGAEADDVWILEKSGN